MNTLLNISHAVLENRFLLASCIFLLSFGLCFVSVIIIKKIAQKFHLMDIPNQRRQHSIPTPRLGGAALAVSFFISFLVLMLCKANLWEAFQNNSSYKAIFVGLSLTYGLGFWDDLRNLKAKHKLYIQLLIASLTYYLGFQINSIAISSNQIIPLNILSFPITIFFLVGLQNAFNFIDGIDGLAAGVAWIILASIAILSFFISLPLLGWMSLIMIASLSAFLYFNRSPASIFMGDSGSLSLGFMLATFSQFPGSLRESPYPIYVVFLFLSLPILDTSVAISRRAIRHLDGMKINIKSTYCFWKLIKQVGKTIMKPDGDHIHHRLLRRYLSHKKVAKTCYLIAFFGSVCACLCTQAPASIAWLITLSFCFFVFQFLISLEYEEFQSKKYRKAKQESQWQKALQSD